MTFLFQQHHSFVHLYLLQVDHNLIELYSELLKSLKKQKINQKFVLICFYFLPLLFVDHKIYFDLYYWLTMLFYLYKSIFFQITNLTKFLFLNQMFHLIGFFHSLLVRSNKYRSLTYVYVKLQIKCTHTHIHR
jgi:hypothetical protein